MAAVNVNATGDAAPAPPGRTPSEVGRDAPPGDGTTRPRTICQCHASVLAPCPGQLETPWTFGYRDIIIYLPYGAPALGVSTCRPLALPVRTEGDVIYTGLKDDADPTREACLRVPRRVLRRFG